MEYLIKKFIKDYKNVDNPIVREKYGQLGSIVGIIVNIFLSAGKFIVGTIFKSVAIVGDAINNLSDAVSCIVTIVSFKLSNKPDDKEHPFGHARIEYISSLAVAVTIIIVAFELCKNSIDKIIHPEKDIFSLVAAIVLIISILAKLWLYYFNKKLGKKISSGIILAAAADSLSDVMATSAVLLSSIISPIINFSLDGYMGAFVSILIFKSGVDIIKDALDKLLGGAPSEETVKLIHDFVCSYDGIYGVHDLMVHDYGPTKTFASLHAEVDNKIETLKSHDTIDNIEQDMLHKHKIHLIIHMDPIVTDDPETNQMKKEVMQFAGEVYSGLTIHDFRMVKGDTHSNLIFDVVVPYDCKKSFQDMKLQLETKIKSVNPRYNAVMVFERDLTC